MIPFLRPLYRGVRNGNQESVPRTERNRFWNRSDRTMELIPRIHGIDPIVGMGLLSVDWAVPSLALNSPQVDPHSYYYARDHGLMEIVR
jgi:hypothetical protein